MFYTPHGRTSFVWRRGSSGTRFFFSLIPYSFPTGAVHFFTPDPPTRFYRARLLLWCRHYKRARSTGDFTGAPQEALKYSISQVAKRIEFFGYYKPRGETVNMHVFERLHGFGFSGKRRNAKKGFSPFAQKRVEWRANTILYTLLARRTRRRTYYMNEARVTKPTFKLVVHSRDAHEELRLNRRNPHDTSTLYTYTWTVFERWCWRIALYRLPERSQP